jgi:hypothetical protein
MTKRQGIDIQTVRRKAPLAEYKKTRHKLDQKRFDDTAWGLEGVGDADALASGNKGPLPDLGDLETIIPATCDEPAKIIILRTIDDPEPTPDSFGPGQTVYEELVRVGDEFDPSLPVLFYRAVWFDGLEAYDPTHYDVADNGNVVPNTVLIPGTVVTATYVKA